MNPWTNWSLNQGTNEINDATIEWVNEAINEWFNGSVNRWVIESTNQWTNESMNQRCSKSVSQYESVSQAINIINEPIGQRFRFSDSIYQSINKPVIHHINDQWINEWRNLANLIFQKCSHHPIPSVSFAIFLWNRALATVSCRFCQLHQPTVLRSHHFWAIFQCKAIVLGDSYRPHLPRVFRSPQFVLRFLCENELLVQYRRHFADLIFQKCCQRLNF